VRPVVSEVFRAPTKPTELGGFLFAPGTQLRWMPDVKGAVVVSGHGGGCAGVGRPA